MSKVAELKEKAAKALATADQIRTDVAEKGGEWDAETDKKFNAALTDFEKLDKEWREAEQKERKIEGLDRQKKEYEDSATKRHRSNGGDPPAKDAEKLKAAHREALRLYLRGGEQGDQLAAARLRMGGFEPRDVQNIVRPRMDYDAMKPEELHALVEGTGNLGGFLVPEDFVAELLKDLAGFVLVRRAGATVRPTTRKEAVYPNVVAGTDPYSSGFAGGWKAEGGGVDPETIGRTTQSQPTFGQTRIPVHLWMPDVVVLTAELLEDTPIALEQELQGVIQETRGLDEDLEFINGNGNGRPEGIIQSGAASVNSGASNNLSYDGLVDLYVALPAQYRNHPSCAWAMSSTTLGLLLKLVDSQSRPLFPMNMMDLPEPRLWGKPIFFSEHIPDGNTDNNKAIILGAFAFYRIADRRELRIQRLVELYAPNVGVLATARVGGKVARTAAFRLQNISA